MATVAWGPEGRGDNHSAHFKVFGNLSAWVGLPRHSPRVSGAGVRMFSVCLERSWLESGQHSSISTSRVQALVSGKLCCAGQHKIPIALNFLSYCLRNKLKLKQWRQSSHPNLWAAEVTIMYPATHSPHPSPARPSPLPPPAACGHRRVTTTPKGPHYDSLCEQLGTDKLSFPGGVALGCETWNHSRSCVCTWGQLDLE